MRSWYLQDEMAFEIPIQVLLNEWGWDFLNLAQTSLSDAWDIFLFISFEAVFSL